MQEMNETVIYTTADKNVYELLLSPVSMYGGTYRLKATMSDINKIICTHLSVKSDNQDREQQELIVYALHMLLKSNRDLLSIRRVDSLPPITKVKLVQIEVYKPGSMSSYMLVDVVDDMSIYKWDNGRDEKFTAWFSKDFDDRIEVDDKDLLIRAIKHERFMQANKKGN